MSTVMMLATMILIAISSQAATLEDPFDVLNRHYQALGGLEKIRSQTAFHTTGTIELVGTGLAGTFEEYRQRPQRVRQDVDLGIITQTNGDNGEVAWTIDQNGKVMLRTDDRTIKERQLKALLGDFQHLDPASEVFTVALAGIDTVGVSHCYVVQVTNNLNDDVATSYYDTASFLELKSVREYPDGSEHTWISDYRDVDGILMPFGQRTNMYPTGMTQIVTIAEVETGLEIDPDLFEPPTTDVADFRFTNGQGSVVVPFQFLEDHIFLPLTVGGVKRLWVLDSGAGATCLDNLFVAELGLQPEGNMKGRGAGNLIDVSWVQMPSFGLPGLEFETQKAAAVDLDWLFRQHMGLEVAGILGYDFLSRLVLRVDFAHQTLTFFHPDSFQYVGEGVVLECPLAQDDMFHVPLTVDGKYSGMWNLDLGAGGLSFHYPYAEAHSFLERPGVARIGHGAGGGSLSHRVQFKSVELAGFAVPDPIISMPAQGDGSGSFASGELAGNLGNWLMRHFVIYLDYHRQQVIVEKGADFGREFPADRSGLQVKKNDQDQCEILFVAQDTPADKAGLQAGDILESVNRIPARLLGGLPQIRELLRAEAGTAYKMVVDRAGKTRKIELKLADLFD